MRLDAFLMDESRKNPEAMGSLRLYVAPESGTSVRVIITDTQPFDAKLREWFKELEKVSHASLERELGTYHSEEEALKYNKGKCAIACIGGADADTKNLITAILKENDIPVEYIGSQVTDVIAPYKDGQKAQELLKNDKRMKGHWIQLLSFKEQK
ncbi:MAG: hypothetical protein ABIP97_06075 [Chthoniobacterales bacterium]